MEPYELSAIEAAAAIQAGSLTVVDVARSLIRRFEQRDPEIRAYVHFDKDGILRQARSLDAAPVKGPLHGVTVGVKDTIATCDMPTEHNTPRYRESRPGIDAACIDTLRACGALIAGKTVTTEFAGTTRGAETRNPAAPGCTPGGSSSGSAAGVADFQAAIGVGSQTGGSGIRPASYCGVYGWKPTWNVVSREGLKMYSATCDTIAFFARTAEDLALLADAFRLDPPEDEAPTAISGLKVGVCRTPLWERALPATRLALDEGAGRLRAGGAAVEEMDLPALFDRLPAVQRAIVRHEGRSALLNEYLTTPELHSEFKAVVEYKDGPSTDETRNAYRIADECRALFDDVASRYDVVLTPSATGEAPVGYASTGDASFNSMWTLLQVPVVNVPGLLGPSGRPVGLSLVARRYQDRKVITVARHAGLIFAQRPLRSVPQREI